MRLFDKVAGETLVHEVKRAWQNNDMSLKEAVRYAKRTRIERLISLSDASEDVKIILRLMMEEIR